VRYHNQSLILSASDLVNFLGCSHATYLDRRQLDEPVPPAEVDPLLAILQEKGIAHERRYLEKLRAEGRQVVEIAGRGALADRHAKTAAAMRSGAEVIYQGALASGQWQGFADFLIRVTGDSGLGPFRYEPVDTKLAQTAEPKHALQLAVYSMLLAEQQGVMPATMQVVLGDDAVVSLRVAEIRHYFEVVREQFTRFTDGLPAKSVGEPCAHCAYCRWSERCDAEWEQLDHLSLVAGITRSQRAKLEAAGISTMSGLAALDPTTRIPGLQTALLQRIRGQATLQAAKRQDGVDRVELLSVEAGRGFDRLPQPNRGDVFFDMEGYPLFDGGLEYLFGFVHVVDGADVYVPFWGHSRAEEKLAFEQAMNFIMTQLAAFPEAYIYHYASYEESALKRLAMLHGTRESEVDHLLRQGKLVDLYQVVREAIQVSEPSYSIKNLETFYMEKRSGEVKSAGASVVEYERWRRLQDPQLLQAIADYNEADCRSTWLLRNWLFTQRPEGATWYTGTADEPVDPELERKRIEAERRSKNTIASLVRVPPEELPFRELVGHLLEFHRREDKPAWWAMFNRQQLPEEELVDDAECLGALRPDPTRPPVPEKKSFVHTFRFPPQDFKMRVTDRPKRANTLTAAGEIVYLDEDGGIVSLKIGAKAEPYENAFSLIPPGPIDSGVLREAVYRYADALIADDGRYGAISSILRREYPRVKGIAAGQPIILGSDYVAQASVAIARLDASHLLVQGPPGTGKTFLSAHTIVDLLAQGRRIGVASNSHKAINNLLQEVERQALLRGIRFRGAKKSSSEEQRLNGAMIEDQSDNAAISDGGFDLIGGTAWLFARPEFDQTLDYLFIDEAGQVSLANVVAMGTCARNIVLVGDQMQLSQPIQGTHPGDSGRSALEFVLRDKATVPPERGIFLAITRRMHPDVCRFISEAVYEGRLEAENGNAAQHLVLAPGADSALRTTGVSWVPVIHEDCSQRSPAEAERIGDIYRSLLEQRWTNRDGVTQMIGTADILVVTPYNMQVNLLKSVLPAGARVGTVDKFQGQEAAAVLVSMTTSTAEDVSRGMEFLYSRNRLNVAISRARCLAVVVASPKLLEARCSTIEQMKLVNTLCFVRAYADGAARVG
jgi:uncharacterized protein